MYLKKLERIQKQTEARGEFTLKKLLLEVIRIGVCSFLKFLPEGIHQPPQQRKMAVENLSLTSLWWQTTEFRVQKLPGNLRGGALQGKKAVEEGDTCNLTINPTKIPG